MAWGTRGGRWLAASAVGFEAGVLVGESMAGRGIPLSYDTKALLVALGLFVIGTTLVGMLLDRVRNPLLVIALLVFGVLGVIFHGAPRAMTHIGYAMIDADIDNEEAEQALVSDAQGLSLEAQMAIAAACDTPRVEAATTLMEATVKSPLTKEFGCLALTRVEYRFFDAALEMDKPESAERWRQRCAARTECETSWVLSCKAAAPPGVQ
jgi:hypothetical protein